MRTRRKPLESIDWAELKRRLAAAQVDADGSVELSPEQTRALLDERARRLARAPTSAERGETLELLAFALGGERYAIEARHVREVVRLQDLTPVPGAGRFVLGVTNLRGEVLCVADLRTFLGVPARGLSDLSRILVLGAEAAEFGVLADEVHEIRKLPQREILAPPETLPGIDREYLLGVTETALIVLDGAALLSDPRLSVDHSDNHAA